jgi:hypothetical protein
MELLTEQVRGHLRSEEAKVIERIEGHYEALEVPYGVVYKWYSGSVLAICQCGKPLALAWLTTTCSECGADHERMVQEELEGECSEDETLHPWRYANREGVEAPCEEVFTKELGELSD